MIEPSGSLLQAGHALIGSLMPEYDSVQKISIVPRGAAGGLTFFAPSEERLESGLYSRSYLENQMAVALGGRVAEELIFGPEEVTTGASGDFQQVCLQSTWQQAEGMPTISNLDFIRRLQYVLALTSRQLPAVRMCVKESLALNVTRHVE